MPARKTVPSAKIEAATSDDVEPIAFTWRGVEFHVLPSDEWSVDVLEAWEDGKAVGTIRGILGDEYETFHALNPKTRDLAEFTEALWAAVGGKGN